MSDDERPPATARRAERGRRMLRASRPFLLRLALCALLAGIAAAPLAVERGLENTEVHDKIGVAPATFTLTGDSQSLLRLGVPGSFYVPQSWGPLGFSATVDGPPTSASDTADVASYFSPQLLEVYSGLFHDPDKAIRGYLKLLEHEIRHEIVSVELLYAGVGGLGLFLITLLVEPTLLTRVAQHRMRMKVAAVAVVLAATSGVALYNFQQWGGRVPTPETVYALPSLDGTLAAGTVTDSAVLKLAIGGAIPKIERLIEQQDTGAADYLAQASSSLLTHAASMDGPRDADQAILMQSDMHCNAVMIKLQKQVVSLLDEKYGDDTISLMAISGDLTTNGTAAEGSCIEDEAKISNGAPIAAVTGNHESATSAEQMKEAGMNVLDGGDVKLAGTKILGAGDPARSEMFGATELRGKATEQSVGEDLFKSAADSDPNLVLMHEGYAAQAFIGGVDDMTTFLDGRGSTTQPWDDGVRDLPASAVFYGHWHRGIEPRVVWNSDGSWTLVMELNTSGGAIDTPALNHFSTPWSRPQQQATFPVIFKNKDSGLITGYQIYEFDIDGNVTVEPRVDIGTPDGQPAS